MNIITLNVLIWIVIFLILGTICCIIFKARLNRDKKLVAAGKEVPEWIPKRRAEIKKCYEQFQNHRRPAFAICVLFTLALYVISIVACLTIS